MKISVIGTGYVGLVTGACLAEIGHEVICLDIDAKKIGDLKKGTIPIYEPGLEEVVRRGVQEKRLFFTTNYPEAVSGSEIVFIAVGTPPGEDGSADLNFVLTAARAIAESMERYTVVVNKSTVSVQAYGCVKPLLRFSSAAS
jgi:UDPglucose 6-dehydrogenase